MVSLDIIRPEIKFNTYISSPEKKFKMTQEAGMHYSLETSWNNSVINVKPYDFQK